MIEHIILEILYGCKSFKRDVKNNNNMLDVFTVFAMLTVISLAHGLTSKSATACFGNTNVECGYLTLECEPGTRIRLISEEYGVKESSCKSGKNRCQNENDGCCAFDPDDCFESYSPLHKYNLYKQCSWQQKCGPIPAPNNVLSKCDGKTSTYVYIEYQCVSENTMLPFCDNTSMTNSEINIVFNGSTYVYEEMIKCDCFVFPHSNTTYVINVPDARMMKQETSGTGSDCSSAVFSELSAGIQYPSCDNSKDEEDNFFSGVPVMTNKTSALQLSNLYREGSKDRPWFLWISLNTNGNTDMYVTCIRTPNSASTTAIPPTVIPSNVSTQATNGTNEPQIDDGGSSAAIVAGVLIPIVLLAIIAAVVVFFIIKRRRKGEKDRPSVRPNNYTSDTVADTQEDEYAEIGIVGDSPEPPIYDPVYEPPLYDPVYESRNKNKTGASSPAENGQILSRQTPSSLKLPTKTDRQSSKSPLRLISSQTDRFFAWFRNRQESSEPKGKNRSREASYDHTHGNMPVIVKVTTPEDTESHVYSHRNDVPRIDNPIEISPKGGRISKDMSAVYLGDAYIGFTFDEIAEDDPKLLKTQATENTPTSRPVPPSRPPPSPNNTPRNSTTSTSPLITNSPKTARPKSPMRLSPLTGTDGKENLTYDYAESQPNSRRGSDASKSDISEHSYKILEKQAVYDYADLEEDEKHVDANATTIDSGGSLYEDVEEKLRAESVKKHKSSADVPDYVTGYEVPLSSQNRPVSAPLDKENKTQNIQTNGMPVIASLNKEMLEKNNLKPLKPPTSPKPGKKLNNAKLNADNDRQKKIIAPVKKTMTPFSVSSSKPSNENSNLVKSDNVDTKDYEKADNLKGVRNMAKLFEKKN